MTKEYAIQSIKEVLSQQKNIKFWSNKYDATEVISIESGRIRVGINVDESQLCILSRVVIARKELETQYITMSLADIDRIYSIDPDPVLWLSGKSFSMTVTLSERSR